MKKMLCAVLVLAFVMLFATAHAKTESELQEALLGMVDGGMVPEFCCEDFDGDGIAEAFAVVQTGKSDGYGLCYIREDADGTFSVQTLDDNFEYLRCWIGGLKAPFTFKLQKYMGENYFDNPEYAVITYYVSGENVGTEPLHEICVVGGDVNMRNKANLEGEVVGYFSEGSMLRYEYQNVVDERGVEWYKVSKDGKEGWVSSKYTRLQAIEVTE